MNCIHCKERKQHITSRELCSKCYSQLHYKNLLLGCPKPPFQERLVKKYGDEILTDFNQSVQISGINLGINLVYISNKYGFTQEYARQISDQLFGNGQYIKLRKEARHTLDIQKRTKTKHPDAKIDNYSTIPKYSNSPDYHVKKGNLTEKEVWDKLISLGFQPIYPLYRSPYDLIVNDKKIEIKGSYISRKTSNQGHTYYYTCNLTKREKEAADYIIFRIHQEDTYYCIPIDKIGGRAVYILDAKNSTIPPIRKTSRKNKWERYKEMWNLLK